MDLAAHTFKDLASVIRDETGICLGPDKSYLVKHRLEPLVRSEGLDGFDNFVQRLRLRSGGRLRSAIVEAITVKETRFFRDQVFFDALQTRVLPACATALGNKASGRHRARIWSAAASTGQEAYSIAILLQEMTEKKTAPDLEAGQFGILATDISAEAIEFAKAGHYSASEVDRGLSESRLSRYFRRRGKHWCIDESLRRMIQFRAFNLLNSPTDLGAFDLILCRNVLIYFDQVTRQRICRGFYAALQAGGWLALGSAESIYGIDDRFETIVVGKTILYRKPQHGG